MMIRNMASRKKIRMLPKYVAAYYGIVIVYILTGSGPK